jgi:dsDNA-specific endonuclease/ATPase MutS2
MTKKAPIKIIKRNERSRAEERVEETKTVNKKSAQEAAREMVSTVSNWVNEFQQKRRAETSKAIKTLFPDPPQPSEA